MSTASIITVSYNSAATIGDTLASVLGQEGVAGQVEYLIQDGGSTDGTADIVAGFAAEHIHFVSAADGGLYDAMNKGLARATGEIIGILNSDDFYAHPRVLRQVLALFEDPRVDAVYGDLQYVAAEDTSRVVRHWRAGAYRREAFRYGWMPPHPTFFVRRKYYEQFGGFNLQLRSAADYELMLRFLYKHGLQAAYLPEVLVQMRTGGQSNASWQNRLRANREDLLAWQLNGLQPAWFTRYLKPLRKVGQFFGV